MRPQKRIACWLIGSSPSLWAETAIPAWVCVWTTKWASSRARCTAEWITKPAAFTSCLRPSQHAGADVGEDPVGPAVVGAQAVQRREVAADAPLLLRPAAEGRRRGRDVHGHLLRFGRDGRPRSARRSTRGGRGVGAGGPLLPAPCPVVRRPCTLARQTPARPRTPRAPARPRREPLCPNRPSPPASRRAPGGGRPPSRRTATPPCRTAWASPWWAAAMRAFPPR